MYIVIAVTLVSTEVVEGGCVIHLVMMIDRVDVGGFLRESVNVGALSPNRTRSAPPWRASRAIAAEWFQGVLHLVVRMVARCAPFETGLNRRALLYVNNSASCRRYM